MNFELQNFICQYHCTINNIMLRQVMGPAVSKMTSKTLQFAKPNGTNYHIWSDNMKSALQAKCLWSIVSGRKLCPPQPPAEFPDLMTSTCPAEGQPLVKVQKDGQELFEVLQSKEYLTWEQSCERYEQ
ncbi:hypothetical protein C0993_001879 [Termitomyces sp. T159_Od127]|nr:hypothetical protein C0993_001879 [Termitomyces sp. T159_Od127]